MNKIAYFLEKKIELNLLFLAPFLNCKSKYKGIITPKSIITTTLAGTITYV